MVSVDVKLNEALEALDKVGKRAKFEEQRKAGSPIEVQLNLAETILKESRVIRKNVFTPLTEVEEAQRTIAKHNGSADLFVEGSPFNGDHSFSEGYVQEKTDPFAAGDKLIMESLGLSAEEQRVLAGQPPAEYASLTEAQKRDFDFARLIGISEVDALKVAKIASIGRNR